jgi:hypothetical protein
VFLSFLPQSGFVQQGAQVELMLWYAVSFGGESG